MRPSNKSRSRNKNNNRRSNNTSGSVVNRVFDSTGPEGRVRGTPQQIIEKYRGLAHDALMDDDRVAAESFQQHAEHYSRILQVAQRQIAERQAEQQAQQAEQQAQQAERQAEQQARQAQQQQQKQQQKEQAKPEIEQPVVSEDFAQETGEQPDVGEHLVATPENKQRSRGPRRQPAKDTSNEVDQAAEDQPQPS
ncbi:MAG: DUF4167 domain-containing protein [Rhodobacteraceae bacterium]|nr:DUF4167 domain-containing protein [Paracoccaceae bacterium]